MITSLRTIKQCFEGSIPSGLATCSKNGMPNVTYLSQVHLIDDNHVALSFQFFNKTKSNIAQNPQASLLVIDPISCVQYRLQLEYVRQETEGLIFERVKTKLDAVASMSGMSHIFRLQGVDIYRVLEWTCMVEDFTPEIPQVIASFEELNEVTQAISECDQLDKLLDTTLCLLDKHFGFSHSMVLLQNADGKSLYTIASYGYDQQGAGAEVKVGDGIIGMVAKQRMPVKISNMQRENIMADAVRQQAGNTESDYVFESRIELPGLSHPNSQLAVPIEAKNKLLGVLFLESHQNMNFTIDAQDLISSIANHLGTAILLCNDEPSPSAAPGTTSHTTTQAQLQGDIVKIRHYQEDNSIFIDSDYLIKGVAGAILWYLLQVYQSEGRTQFTNRELRKDSKLKLPEIVDNLEARLVLLLRRLNDRCAYIKIEKTGRGRFTLVVNNPLDIMSVASS